MQIEHALERYLTQLRADGRSESTAGQYRRHIALLGRWLHKHVRCDAVEEIDHETLALFLASPRARTRPDGKAKKATSTNALRTSLRTFFRYAHDAGYTRSNPARLVRRALCGTPPIRALSDDEDLERGELQLRTTKGNVPTSVPPSRAICDHLRGYVAGRANGLLFPLSSRHAQRRLEPHAQW